MIVNMTELRREITALRSAVHYVRRNVRRNEGPDVLDTLEDMLAAKQEQLVNIVQDELTIVKVLEISTAHLPQYDGTHLTEIDDVIAHELGEYGYLMFVPEEPMIEALERGGRRPSHIVKIQMYARMLGCDYVRFDRDANILDDLPTWDW